MPRYLIERNIPGAGNFSVNDLRGIARKSRDVIRDMGPDIQWLQSFIADNKMYCMYLGKDEAIIRRHAELSGFPASKISEVGKIIDSTTGD